MEYKVINEVRSSVDYGAFSFMDENRDLNISKVEKLKESMKRYALEKPIDVNERHQIIDGQHRFFAWQELKMPIIYIVHPGWGIAEVPILNINQNNWKPTDYVKMYSKLGNNEYIMYQEFSDKWGFPHNSNLFLLTSVSGKSTNTYKSLEKFREGRFKIKQWNKANIIARNLAMVKEFFPNYKRSAFVRAYVAVFDHPKFKNMVLINKLKIQGRNLVGCSTYDQYFEVLKEIYNYRQRGRENKLIF